MELEQLIKKLQNGEDIIMLTFKQEGNSPLINAEWVTYTKDDYSLREENGEYFVKFKDSKKEEKVSKIRKYVK